MVFIGDHETPPHYQFLKCDVRVWAEQLVVFKAAKQNSPHKSIDIVVANAGITGYDPVFSIGTLHQLITPNCLMSDPLQH